MVEEMVGIPVNNNKTQNNNEKQQASGFLGKAASYVSGIATDASYAFGDMVEEMVGIPVNNNKTQNNNE
eukprot:CAMPEP_0206193712 /NCGR_PEP_ID=MMETSP0166-20121206/6737_1 /ASSEMBLY_ACC=CAM_ASM_000260 /TAXON_ID=95228 /ORGANISM="Vannella robusta, Strain DIVA3 518/3/11/1/6" /LENGTH=68 /DNA_ID=CAMNT_0053610491 /DNA_START=722 /DNA_END=925 /DNA_ORIENTATION=+